MFYFGEEKKKVTECASQRIPMPEDILRMLNAILYYTYCKGISSISSPDKIPEYKNKMNMMIIECLRIGIEEKCSQLEIVIPNFWKGTQYEYIMKTKKRKRTVKTKDILGTIANHDKIKEAFRLYSPEETDETDEDSYE